MATVAKAFRLLDCFSPVQAELGLSDLARQAGFDKATTYRLLGELALYGMVSQDPQSRAYRLGPALTRLAALREMTQPNDLLARPAVETLSARVAETAHLSLLEGERLVTALVARGRTHTTQIVLGIGEVLPFHATASGLAVLAALPTDRRKTLLRGPVAKFTDRTETDRDRLDATVRAAARAGFAESVGGYEVDVHGTAMALCDACGNVAGAIGVAVPVSRMSPAHGARIRAAIADAAADITRSWGGIQPTLARLETAR